MSSGASPRRGYGAGSVHGTDEATPRLSASEHRHQAGHSEWTQDGQKDDNQVQDARPDELPSIVAEAQRTM